MGLLDTDTTSEEGRRRIAMALLEAKSGMPELRISYANAMWAWAGVESETFAVYFAATNSYGAKFAALQESFFNVVSARGRLDMTNAAAKAAWGDTQRWKEWAPLAERCRKELGARGRVAHLQGVIAHPEKSHQKPLALLLQHTWHPEHSFKYGERKNKGITADQLDQMRVDWTQLTLDLNDFSRPIIDAGLKQAVKMLAAHAPPRGALSQLADSQSLRIPKARRGPLPPSPG